MTQPPNLQKLIITNKNYHPSKERYATDMRTIEQWANEGIVRKLIAGSNITLTPSSGVDTGTGIEIAASGGGSGLSAGFVNMIAGPDDFDDHVSAIWFGIGAGYAYGDLNSFFPIFSSSTVQTVVSFAAGWFAPPGPTYSACILPTFTVPAFTGGGITMQVNINAANVGFTDFAIYEQDVNVITFTSGETYQLVPSDFDTHSSGGTDLVMTSGTGPTQNGLVTTAGGKYFGGVSGYFTIASGTTFT
jgi:hypothetical protein